jgi:hypothetical protein
LSSRIGKGYIKPHKYVLSVLYSFTLSIPMQQGKARSNGKGTMQRGKGWAKQQGANIGSTNIVSSSYNKRNTIQRAKGEG